METIAIYWEPVIKTYGILERSGLSLVTLPISSAAPDSRATGYLEAASTWDNVKIVFASSNSPGGLSLKILVDGPPPQPLGDNEPPPGLYIEAPVELVYFQGPHFGDRYGIADTALGALADHGLSLKAMVCAGASVYLVMAPGGARKAGQILSQAFVVPTSVESGPGS
ncbi:MAG: hypothetical protein WBG37_21020 [Desulfobacterales bacterium]|jgi:hypothetical protein